MLRGRTPTALIYAYAHEDKALRDQLETHLSLLQREGWISFWHDRELRDGNDWVGQIDQHLNEADLILLLVSASFIDSDYCYDVEMFRALERHQHREAIVVTIIIHNCDWGRVPFGKLQALPRNTQAVTSWVNQDEAFTEIVKALHILVEHSPSPNNSRQANQNRERICQHLQLWYQQFLQESLLEAAWLELRLADKPDALISPVALLFDKYPPQSDFSLPVPLLFKSMKMLIRNCSFWEGQGAANRLNSIR